MKKYITAALAILCLSAQAASFDCAKAKSAPERLICADSELSALDDEASVLYSQARARASDAEKARLKAEQVAAWKERERTCTTKECVKDWLLARKAALEAFQPGAVASTPVAKASPASNSFLTTTTVLGAPRVNSKADFERAFGYCQEEGPDTLQTMPVPGAASTCVVRNSPSCAKALNVGRCNLVRYAFNRAGQPVLALFTVAGRNSVNVVADTIVKRYGTSMDQKQNQSNGYAIFQNIWDFSEVRIESQTMMLLGGVDINSDENVSLIWVVRK